MKENRIPQGKYYKWEDIYCRFFSVISDNNLNNMPTNLMYKMLGMYMKQAIGYFEDDCRKNISEYNDFRQFEKYYTYDSSDNQLYFEADNEYEKLYIAYTFSNDEPYKEITDYAYDKDNHVITILQDIGATQDKKAEIYIATYNIGSFLETEKLNDTEVGILVMGIEALWTNSQRMKESLLRQRVYSESSKIYSQANHIQAVNELHNSIYFKQMKQAIIDYTYKQSKDDYLWKLGGRNSAYELGEE